jgi:hypothetical protein
MNLFRRTVMTLGSMTVVALVIALAAPKVAHGIVATLVQVTNPASNPVNVTDVSSLQLFQTECTSRLTFVDSTNDCSFSLPLGKRLVVQTASIHAQVDPGVRVAQSGFAAGAGGSITVIWFNVPFTGTTPNSRFDISQASQELRFYADSSGLLQCSVLYNQPTTNNELRCSVAGYLINTQ